MTLRKQLPRPIFDRAPKAAICQNIADSPMCWQIVNPSPVVFLHSLLERNGSKTMPLLALLW